MSAKEYGYYNDNQITPMDVELIVKAVVERVIADEQKKLIPVEASGRHVHLSAADAERLFGNGYEFKVKHELSQPGQYLCEERVRIIGPKGIFNNVALLGPVRAATQVELSYTDCLDIGVRAPLRESGDAEGGACVFVSNASSIVHTDHTIVARNHIHMTFADAERFGVCDGDKCAVKVHSRRPIIFEDVLIRCNDNFRLAFHIDYDEANACLYEKNMKCEIWRG